MSTFEVRYRRGRERTGFVPCENGCRSKLSGSDLGRKSASHVAVIYGHEVALCGPCAKEWQRIWDGAHDEVPA